jgi:hypothetical protein
MTAESLQHGREVRMSLEGMWAAYFGDVGGGQVNSGIAVLETGRVFGGDSYIAYLGNYEIHGNAVTAAFRTWAYNPTIVVTTAFGEVGPAPTDVRLEGEFDTNAGQMGEITGQVWRTANPAVKLQARLVKIENLPG